MYPAVLKLMVLAGALEGKGLGCPPRRTVDQRIGDAVGRQSLRREDHVGVTVEGRLAVELELSSP